MGTEDNSIEIREKRRGDRVKYEIPDFVYAEFSLRRKEPKEDKSYVLKVMDWSTNGLGMVVTPKDFDLLYQVKVGDILQNMAFFAERAMVKVDGTIRHKSVINEGKYKGCFMVGIESPEILEGCRPAGH
jgi:hypothetical protein